MIKLSELSCSAGDKSLTIDDSNSEDRKKLAVDIISLLIKGVYIAVKTKEGKDLRISGYDALSNEWIIHPASAATVDATVLPKKRGRKPKVVVEKEIRIPKKRGRPRKVSAEDSTATAIAPIAGG